jgi:NAD(P)-dependent dehydrogenase (short-subunit alcohol dehydrogenase family)
MDDFTDKVALVTGAGSGLGRAMARRFAGEGMTVVVTDVRLEAARETVDLIEQDGGRATAAKVDVTERAELEALAGRIDAELGGVHVLAANAGVMTSASILEGDEAAWRWLVEVNVFGSLNSVQVFVPRMLATGKAGHVVITASHAALVTWAPHDENRVVLGHDAPNPLGGSEGYGVTKHAVLAMAELLSADLAGTPIGVSVLCPGHFATGIYSNSARLRPAAYGGPMMGDALAQAETFERATDDYAAGTSEGTKRPEEAAARVVHAIRHGQFFVMTHPTWREDIDRRRDQIAAGLADSAAFPGE